MGNHIRPSTLYGTQLPPELKARFNRHAYEKIPLVYAARQFSKALAYAFDKTQNEVYLNFSTELPKSNREVVFICDSERAMTRDRNATVYALSADSFVDLDKQQCVSDKEIKFNECSKAYHVKNALDILRGGVQVFSVEETFDEIQRNGFKQHIFDIMFDKNFYAQMGELVRNGVMKWENLERGINLDKELGKTMGFSNLEIKRAKLDRCKM